MKRTCEPSVLPWRITFALAAAYNLAFGVWAVLMPFGFFDLFGLERPVYPGIWSCLGMVIGLYGLGYAYIAWKPERGDVLALLGLLGNLLETKGVTRAVELKNATKWPHGRRIVVAGLALVRRAARHGLVLRARGTVEREGEVIHIMARSIHTLDDRFTQTLHRSRDFR